jgi:hypothetical protein
MLNRLKKYTQCKTLNHSFADYKLDIKISNSNITLNYRLSFTHKMLDIWIIHHLYNALLKSLIILLN